MEKCMRNVCSPELRRDLKLVTHCAAQWQTNVVVSSLNVRVCTVAGDNFSIRRKYLVNADKQMAEQ